MTHTPGPLQIVEAKTPQGGGVWPIYVADEHGKKIAALWGRQGEKIGNAVLFVAAPVMLAALHDAQAALFDIDVARRKGYIERAKKSVVAAIAKATGT